MSVPQPTSVAHISRIIPLFGEMLEYCMREAVLSSEPGSLTYSTETNEITYHLKIMDLDRDVLPVLHGCEEIWIITKAAGEES